MIQRGLRVAGVMGLMATKLVLEPTTLRAQSSTSQRPALVIGILGATGATGREVMSLALERGYQVRALARDASKLDAAPQVEVIQGDANSAEAISQLVSGADVVVSCIGNSNNDTTMSNLVINLLPALSSKSGTQKRLVMMTSIGCGGTSPVVKFCLSCMFGFKGVGDMDEADSMVRENVKNPFVIVRPPRLDKVPGKGSYLATDEHPQGCPIVYGMAYADVALFIMDVVEDKQWDGKAVQLYSQEPGPKKDAGMVLSLEDNLTIQKITRNNVIQTSGTEAIDN